MTGQAGHSFATAGYVRERRPNPLRVCRLLRAMTQRDVASASGVHRITVGRIERGLESPRPSTRTALAAALDYPEDVLFPPGDLDEYLNSEGGS